MKSILIILSIAIAAVAIFNSCKSRSGTTKSKANVQDLWLNSHRPSAKPNIYSAQFAPEYLSDAWQEMSIPIEGFTYTAGHVYHLRVEEVSESDTKAKQYRLLEIVSTEIDPLQQITDIYVLRAIPNEMNVDQLQDIRCTLELNAASRTVMGSAPCNQYSGTITELTTTDISFGPIMATKMACQQLSTERMFFQRLAAVKSYERKKLLLHLKGKDGESLLILQKVD